MFKIKINSTQEIFYCDEFSKTKYGYKFKNVIKLSLPNGLPIDYIMYEDKMYIKNRIKSKCGNLTMDDIDISIIEIDGSELDVYLFDYMLFKTKPWWKRR